MIWEIHWNNRSMNLKVDLMPKCCRAVYYTVTRDFTALESYHSGNSFVFQHNCNKMNSRNTAGMCACIWLTTTAVCCVMHRAAVQAWAWCKLRSLILLLKNKKENVIFGDHINFGSPKHILEQLSIFCWISFLLHADGETVGVEAGGVLNTLTLWQVHFAQNQSFI